MTISNLVDNANNKKFEDFNKSFKNVFNEKFDSQTKLLEKEVIKELSRFTAVAKNETNCETKDTVTESLNICSIEEPEDSESIIIKYEIDGEEKEVAISDSEKKKFYQNIKKEELSELDDDIMKQIKQDVLESCVKKRKK